MIAFRELETVVLKRDMPRHGLRRGDLGAVVFVYGAHAIEVEFVRGSGHTQALVRLATKAVRRAGDDDMHSVRRVDRKPG